MTTEIETITWWSILKEPWATLHLPRFALFLLFAIILEALCAKKRPNQLCSWSTVITLCLTTLGGLVILYYMLTTAWVGCVAIPWWYYPLTLAYVIIAVLIFSRGATVLWKDGFYLNSVIRSIVFIAAIYFTTTTIITPSKLNDVWIKGEPDRIEQSHWFSERYLYYCKELNISPDLKAWGDEAKKYRNTIPELIELNNKVKESFHAVDSAIIEAANSFESLTTNQTISVSEDDHFSPEFEQYLETKTSVSDTENNAFNLLTMLHIKTLEYMISDYRNQGKMIDTEWMREDMYKPERQNQRVTVRGKTHNMNHSLSSQRLTTFIQLTCLSDHYPIKNRLIESQIISIGPASSYLERFGDGLGFGCTIMRLVAKLIPRSLFQVPLC